MHRVCTQQLSRQGSTVHALALVAGWALQSRGLQAPHPQAAPPAPAQTQASVLGTAPDSAGFGLEGTPGCRRAAETKPRVQQGLCHL